MMDLTLESTKSRLDKSRYKRRSSLFKVQENENNSPTLDCKHDYPLEYIEKLKTEFESWRKELIKYHTELSEKKRKLTSKTLFDRDVLDKEQQDFLSSLPDYTEYLHCVVDFNNKFDTAIDMLNLEKEGFRESKKHLTCAQEKILQLCQTRF